MIEAMGMRTENDCLGSVDGHMVLFVVFVLAPVIELYTLIKVGSAIGGWNTIGLLIVIAMIGSWLIKREGFKAWTRFAASMQSGQPPARPLADGVCVLLAGLLLMVPGFVSDVLALLLLFPPTRAIARAWLLRRTKLGRMGGLGRNTVITATYGGRMPDAPHDLRDGVITTTGTETATETARPETPRGEIER